MTNTTTDHVYAGTAPAPMADVAMPTHAAQCRSLAAANGLATLATLRPDGRPFTSVVQYVLDDRGQPVIVISELAEHTKNIRLDGRASILVATELRTGDDPMALPRLTLGGTLRELTPEEQEQDFASAGRASGVPLRDRYVAAHPTASEYIGFGDFRFWRLNIDSVRFVGGYGRMSWVTVEEYLATAPDPLAAHAVAIVEHMNTDHADACLTYVRHYAPVEHATSARMIGVDHLGMDFIAVTPGGLQPTRVNFDEEQFTPGGVRQAVVALLMRARENRAQA